MKPKESETSEAHYRQRKVKPARPIMAKKSETTSDTLLGKVQRRLAIHVTACPGADFFFYEVT